MTRQKYNSGLAIMSVVVSVIGLGLLPLLILNPPPSFVIPWQNSLVGAVFALICIFGIIAGISPTHCSRSSSKQKSDLKEDLGEGSTRSVASIHKKGHHPTCDRYTGHVLRINSRIFCAGCTGLVIGALIALIGTGLVFFAGFYFPTVIMIFWLGWGFVAIGLLQHHLYRLFRLERGEARFLLNVLFVVGAFLLLATQMQITNNLLLASYLLVLTVYWIFTRIVMSRWSHQRICNQCGKTDCSLLDV
ncbi:MAG: hypothetical protein ACFFCH_08200 [Promethearchaeota archaeon]